MIGMDVLRSVSRSILILLSIGIALRLLLMYALVPSVGGTSDIVLYMYWAHVLADVGPGGFYASAEFADYPPGYLYVLWLVGKVSQSIAAAQNLNTETVARWLIKVPPILLDACAAFMLYCIARSWPKIQATAERVGLTAAAIYIFNPVTVYDSAIWGQTDAAGACVMLAALISLMRGPPELTTSIAVFAALIKPQFGMILAPLVGAVLLRRHVALRSAASGCASMERVLWLHRNGPIRLLTSACVGVVLFYALVTPFNLGFRSFLERMAATANGYKFLSVNAFNPWALVGSGKTRAMVFTGVVSGDNIENWSRDDIPLVSSITGVEIGGVLLALGFLIGVARLLWRADRWSLVCVGFYLNMCFFMLPTRVHERYLLTAFAFAPLLAVFDRRWLWATGILTVGLFMNLHGVLTALGLSLPLGEPLRSPTGMLISISLHSAVFLFAIWSLRPRAEIFSVATTNPSVYTQGNVSQPPT
jgi:Gpi18-like mannosyltransferase